MEGQIPGLHGIDRCELSPQVKLEIRHCMLSHILYKQYIVRLTSSNSLYGCMAFVNHEKTNNPSSVATVMTDVFQKIAIVWEI